MILDNPRHSNRLRNAAIVAGAAAAGRLLGEFASNPDRRTLRDQIIEERGLLGKRKRAISRSSQPRVKSRFNMAPRYRRRGTRSKRKSTRPRASSRRGKRSGSVRKVKRKKMMKRRVKYGSTFTCQRNTTFSSAHCVYIGHAVPIGRIWYSVWEAIVHKLFTKAGISIRCMQDRIQEEINTTHLDNYGQITFSYRTASVAARSVNLLANTTFNDVAVALMTEFMNHFDDSTTTPNTQLVDIYLTDDSGYIAARVDLSNLMIEMNHDSKFVFQNRTLAVGNGDDALDVENNPLTGRYYTGNGQGLRFRPVRGDNADQITFMCNAQTGLILYSSGTASSSQVQLQTTHPPLSNVFSNCKSSGRVSCAPGAHKLDVLKYKRKISLNSLFKMSYPYILKRTFSTRESSGDVTIGICKIFALERMLSAGTEPEVLVGVENTLRMRTAVYEKKPQLIGYQNILDGSL